MSVKSVQGEGQKVAKTQKKGKAEGNCKDCDKKTQEMQQMKPEDILKALAALAQGNSKSGGSAQQSGAPDLAGLIGALGSGGLDPQKLLASLGGMQA